MAPPWDWYLTSSLDCSASLMPPSLHLPRESIPLRSVLRAWSTAQPDPLSQTQELPTSHLLSTLDKSRRREERGSARTGVPACPARALDPHSRAGSNTWLLCLLFCFLVLLSFCCLGHPVYHHQSLKFITVGSGSSPVCVNHKLISDFKRER